MKARVEVRPGKWRVLSGPPGQLLQSVVHQQGRRPSDSALRTVAAAWRYERDPDEIWPHPETLLATAKKTGTVAGDCEDWTRLVCYFAERPYVPQVLRVRAGLVHARPITEELGRWFPFDLSAIKEIAKKAVRSPYARWAKKAAVALHPWSAPLLWGLEEAQRQWRARR